MTEESFKIAHITYHENNVLANTVRVLKLVYEVHCQVEQKEGSGGIATIYRKATMDYLKFFRTETMSPEFIILYNKLKNGIRGTIILANYRGKTPPETHPHHQQTYEGYTPHGIPYEFDFRVDLISLIPAYSQSYDTNGIVTINNSRYIRLLPCNMQHQKYWTETYLSDGRRGTIMPKPVNDKDPNTLYTETYTQKYIDIVKKKTGKTISAISIPMVQKELMCEMRSVIRQKINEKLSKHMQTIAYQMAHIDQGYNEHHHKCCDKLQCITEDDYNNMESIHHHFMTVSIMQHNEVPEGEPLIGELIDMILPDEETFETEIRADLRSKAHFDANARFLVAQLHLAHKDAAETGKLLMVSAADDGSTRAADYCKKHSLV